MRREKEEQKNENDALKNENNDLKLECRKKDEDNEKQSLELIQKDKKIRDNKYQKVSKERDDAREINVKNMQKVEEFYRSFNRGIIPFVLAWYP